MPGKSSVRITEEIAIKCDLLDQMIERFLVARNSLDGAYKKYESHCEALNLFSLVIRHVEGVIKLARTDLALLPPAQVVARAAFEGASRAAWLVNATDPYECETRWLAHFRTECDYMRRQIRDIGPESELASSSKNRLKTLNAFGNGVAALLAERGYRTDLKVPDFREVLRSMGEEQTYILYTALSQTEHATHASTWLYRSGGVGTEKIEGEFVSADEWSLPLNLCRFVFKTPGAFILSQLGADTKPLLDVAG